MASNTAQYTVTDIPAILTEAVADGSGGYVSPKRTQLAEALSLCFGLIRAEYQKLAPLECQGTTGNDPFRAMTTPPEGLHMKVAELKAALEESEQTKEALAGAHAGALNLATELRRTLSLLEKEIREKDLRIAAAHGDITEKSNRIKSIARERDEYRRRLQAAQRILSNKQDKEEEEG